MKALVNIRSMMACLALAAAAPAVDAQVRPYFYGSPTLDRSQVAFEDGLEPVLVKLRNMALAGADWQSAAAQAGLMVQDGRVLVETRAMLASDLAGGLPGQSVYSGDPSRIRAWVNPADLAGQDDASSESVRAVRMPVANSYGDAVNEAESLMLADKYQLAGDGVKVFVIDIGFGGIDAMESETGNVDRIQHDLDSDEQVHGTAMIEAIRDISPGARVTALRLDADLDVIGATTAAIARRADIIVCPLSWFELPNRGQASEAARMATQARILWVNAAGNFGARRYHEAQALPVMNIGSNTFVTFDAQGTDPYQFVNGMQAGDPFSVHFASQQGSGMALELYQWNGMSATFTLIAAGNHSEPDQVVSHSYQAGMYYFPMIRKVSAGPVAPFRMFSVGADLHFHQAAGSIANPAATPGVISVGAVSSRGYAAGGAPELYSSQGGGIFNLTLTLCGPTDCTTGSYGPQGFSGTSASSANIAGLLALQLSDAALAADPLGMLEHADASGVDIVFALVDEFEFDNDMDTAGEIGAAHMISPSHDQDWFYFEMVEQMDIRLSTGDRQAPGLTSFADTAGLSIELIHAEGKVLQAGREINMADLEAGVYYVRVSTNSLNMVGVEYTLALDIFEGAPGRVETMTPGAYEQISTNEVTLAWVGASGIGAIQYRVVLNSEVSREARVFVTAATSLTVKLNAGITRWSVIAFNQYGEAASSDVHVIEVVLALDSFSAADAIAGSQDQKPAFETQKVELLAAGQPAGGEGSEAAGCSSGKGASGLALMIGTMLLAAGVIRARKAVNA